MNVKSWFLCAVFFLGASLSSGEEVKVASVRQGGGQRLSWNTLISTWGQFIPVATTSSADEWQTNGNCSSGAPGYRIAKNGDVSTMPFFTPQGVLAGIQLGVPLYSIPPEFAVSPFQLQTLYNGTSFYALTFFFIKPQLACPECLSVNVSQPLNQKAPQRLGDRLWLKMSANSFLKLPLSETSNLIQTEGWVKGQCFNAMGLHYWKNVTTNLACENFFPVFLLFNNGILNAFGTAIPVGSAQLSERWEHPPPAAMNYFFQPESLPSCLVEPTRILSTQHIYLTNPALNLCP